MFFFTHLFISKALYQYFSKEIDLDQQAFSYGNIKPDIPFNYDCHHTLENCIFKVYNSANRLLGENISVEERSVGLGEICHYVCDFFCYCHLNEEIHNKKLRHLIYELKLHHEIYKSYPNRKYIILPSKRMPRKDIASIIFEMRRTYYSQPEGMKRDLECALLTVTWICESMTFFLKKPLEEISEQPVPSTIYKI